MLVPLQLFEQAHSPQPILMDKLVITADALIALSIFLVSSSESLNIIISP